MMPSLHGNRLGIFESTAAAAQDSNSTNYAPDLQPTWALWIELPMLLVYVTDVALKSGYTGGLRQYYKNNQHKLYSVIILLLSLDWILFASGAVALRFFRALRPGILVVRNRELRKTVRSFYDLLSSVA